MKAYFENTFTLATVWLEEFYALGQNFKFKFQVVFLVIKFPVVPQRVNRGEWEKEVIIYFWYGKRHLNDFPEYEI